MKKNLLNKRKIIKYEGDLNLNKEKKYIENNKYQELKEFLNPIVKEEETKQLLNYYITKYCKNLNKPLSTGKNDKNKPILEYSFLTDRRQSIKNEKYDLRTNNSNKNITNNINNKNKSKNNSSKNINSKNKINSLSFIYNVNIKKNNRRSEIINFNIHKIAKNLYNEGKIKEQDTNKNIIDLRKIQNIVKNIEVGNSEEKKNVSFVNKEENGTFHQLEKVKSMNKKNGNNKKKRNNEKFNIWYSFGKDWEKIKEIRKDIIKMELEEKENECFLEEKEEETFRPKINKKSSKIVSQLYPNDFYDRLIHFEKKKLLRNKKIEREYTPIFKPKINKSYNSSISKRSLY